ncbi:GNAT family N-acetyltransferase [Deinococcus pimensis]|uniref:GNAT family N-acetyltransferase n=1 Tax=Deinococcus pimensis TaxID=309888 RepID=UPI0004B1F0D3|nr:GNAT family N-acetyltransferase [Deinococcus pimensis]
MTLTENGLRVVRDDPRTAPDETLRAVALHREAIRAERLPDDPPWVIDKLVHEMRHPDSDEEVVQFNTWDGDRVVAHLALFFPTVENTHLVFIDLSVQASHRGRGVGTDLLRRAVDEAGARERRRLITSTNERVPAGEAFARRLGAQEALATHQNQLVLAELDRDLLLGWERDAERHTDYRPWVCVGAYPEERLDAIVDIWNVMNTAPRGDLDMEDWQMTPQRLREWQAKMLATGERRVTTFVDHVPTGRIVAYSELFWDPRRDTLLFQGATAAHPDHRGHGLGRLVKARNLRETLDRNPTARYVRTGNADSNRWMLAINHAMGFRPFISFTEWQADVSALREALAR